MARAGLSQCTSSKFARLNFCSSPNRLILGDLWSSNSSLLTSLEPLLIAVHSQPGSELLSLLVQLLQIILGSGPLHHPLVASCTELQTIYCSKVAYYKQCIVQRLLITRSAAAGGSSGCNQHVKHCQTLLHMVLSKHSTSFRTSHSI